MNGNFYRNILFRIMTPARNGRLTFEMPDGARFHFGVPDPRLDACIIVRDIAMFRKVVFSGDIGFGESYMDGDWTSNAVDRVISWFIMNKEFWPAISGTSRRFSVVNGLSFANKLLHLFRSNTLAGSRKNIRAHYDLSNEFFETFLDRGMTYSCAYFESQDQDLESAQAAKYDKLCQKLHLKPEDHLLEIGSGWGGFAIHAAKNYGCKITTLTISEEQYRYAKERIRAEGLSHKINILLRDYREIEGRFDKIVSIEMLEAVGDKYLEVYFSKCSRLLKSDGLMAVQVITSPDSRYKSFKKNVDWIQKHIFPGSLLPSVARIQGALQKTGELMLHDLEDMGLYYAQTLRHWQETFRRNGDRVRALGMNQRFINKWDYYFSYCKAAFQTRNISVIQAVYTRPNNWMLKPVSEVSAALAD